MRLTTYSDYSLRVLIYLGLTDEGLATIQEIAEAYGISRNHLMKVVHHLGRLGLVETLRGKGGGLRLAKPPEAIGVGAVVRATEEDMALVPCFGAEDPQACRIEGVCRLQGVLHEALDAFLAVLDRYTLADLLAGRGGLARRLGAPATTRSGPSAPH